MSVKTVVGSEKVHGGIYHMNDDVWLHEHATMNRAQKLFVDEQLARIRRTSLCFEDKTMQIRPTTTYDLTAECRICLLDLRDAPNREFEAIR